ncbi:MAG: phosphatase PAP2 family protein [Promethearchaeia archaeon]
MEKNEISKKSELSLDTIKEIIEDIDYEVIVKIQKLRTKAGNYFWHAISFLGYPFVWSAISIIAIIIELYHITLVLTFAGLSSLIIFPIKMRIERCRPYDKYKHIRPLTREKDSSFPSGHTYFATVSAMSLAFCYGDILLILGMLCLSIFVAISRVYLGVHYPSDVAASLILGIIVAMIIYLLFPHIMVLHYLVLES